MTTILAAVPIVPARDLNTTTGWYRDLLGFSVRHVEREYGIVERDGVEVHFWGPSGIEPSGSTAMYRLGVRDIRPLYETCAENGSLHPESSLDEKPWGTTEFAVIDCDGNLVTFFERST